MTRLARNHSIAAIALAAVSVFAVAPVASALADGDIESRMFELTYANAA